MSDNENDSPIVWRPAIPPRDRVIVRLRNLGIGEKYLHPAGLASYAKTRGGSLIDGLVKTLMGEEDEVDESIMWIKWLMFDGDPEASMKDLLQMSSGQGVCGAVFGRTDIAYRCKTCELDSTCAICITCFENGVHKGQGHDYSVLYTGGGCCDCGDETAWKPEGFCTIHKGAQNIILPLLEQRLEKNFAPVLVSLFNYWKSKLRVRIDRVMGSENLCAYTLPIDNLTHAVVDMLLEFCNSGSLLKFVANLLLSCSGLLYVLVRAEMGSTYDVVKTLHKFLLKLLGDFNFKSKFAEVFLEYYPSVIEEGIKHHSDISLKRFPLLSVFSVQIFTLPSLTLGLVKDFDLLTILLGCLDKIFVSCAEEGRLKVSQWGRLYETTMRVIEDIHFVISHADVSIYVTSDRQDLLKTWIGLLSYMHEMNYQQQHATIEYGNLRFPFVLCRSIARIHSLLVDGALSNARKGEIPNSACETIFNCADRVLFEVETTSPDRTRFEVDTASEELYDVGSQDKGISVHIPLHRFLSMLLQKALRRHCESEVPDVACSTDSDFFVHAFREIMEHDAFFVFIMEHPLRIMVFPAALRAGMWYGNGSIDAARSYIQYISTEWSEQTLELDLFLLQCCGAIIEKDLFVKRIIKGFGLLGYVDYPSMKHEPTDYDPVLVERMLTLIIQIVKDRRFCGLTTIDSLKRELIYKLSTGDATRSQLVQSIPCDLSDFEQLQSIVDMVASNSNPSGVNQRMYSLKPKFWKELDLYHPRWTPMKLKQAEERYFDFCGFNAQTTQVPKWTKIYSPLREIANIATCKVVLEIIRAVFFYAVFPDICDVPLAPDSVLLPALHLLSLSLDICFQQKEQNSNNVAQIPIIKLSGEMVGAGFLGIGEQSLLSLLVSWRENRRKENAESLLVADSLFTLVGSILKKFSEIDDSCKIHLGKLNSNHIPECVLSPTIRKERDQLKQARQAAAMARMRANQEKFLAMMANISNVDDGSQHDDEGGSDSVHEGDLDTKHDYEELEPVVCCLCKNESSGCPILYLILLQKSRLVSSVNRGPPSCTQLSRSGDINTKEIDTVTIDRNSGSLEPTSSSQLTQVVQDALPSSTKRKKKREAKKKREMSALSSQLLQLVQNVAGDIASSGKHGEVNTFLQYVKNQFPELGNIQLSDMSYGEIEKMPCTFETLESNMYASIRNELRDLLSSSSLMNEDEKIPISGGNSNATLNTGSALLSKYTSDILRELSEISSTSFSENSSVKSISHHLANDRFGPIDCDGAHLTACGHAVHQKCLDEHLSAGRGHFRGTEGGHFVDPDQGEFPCPTCLLLVNCVLPTLPGEVHEPFIAPSAQSNDMISSLRLQQAFKLLQSAAKAVENDKFLKAVPLHHVDTTELNLESFSSVLSKMYFSGNEDKLSTFARLNHSMLMWDTLKYSLMSMEIVTRCGKTSLTPNLALSAMYEELKSKDSSGYTLPFLLKLVQKTRSHNSVHVLQRFRGVQLFAESICNGVSLMSNRGNMFSILKRIEMNMPNADICFWNLASNPVLANDPFAILMWVLFCLPHPFLSCEESLISLVHVFYVVAVTQAIILYYEKSRDKSSREPSLSDCLITDVYKNIREYGCVSQYFVSNYFEFDPSVGIKDMIRRFSFPYLRRCALLWKILYSSIPPPFCGKDTMSSNNPKDTMDEVTEIEELENMFKIPPLDVVLKDEFSRSSVSTWCRHFCKEFQSQRIQRNIHVTPAVPFELMKLPSTYDELLKRYIKQHCPDCNSCLGDDGEPALCLMCGRLCSQSWNPCCSKSGCQTHAATCGAGTGVFLLIRNTNILLLRSARQALLPSPYLDGFDEEDIEFRRGKPLFLKEEYYAELTHMVASHHLEMNSKFRGKMG